MNNGLLDELAAAHQSRTPCALVTVVGTRGSVPRATGSKMLVYADGRVSGTIGGGKFEALVVSDAQRQMQCKQPTLKTYPLHESSPESFGAICGGESTVFIEPQVLNEAIFLIGAGHCALATAKLAMECGMFVTVVDDRTEQAAVFPPRATVISEVSPAEFIKGRHWQADEALVLVSRNYEIDRDALAAAINITEISYIGMIGSTRKVQRVFDQLMETGVTPDQLRRVHAPIGLDIGADAPAEIAVSILAEVLSVLRHRKASPLSSNFRRDKGVIHS